MKKLLVVIGFLAIFLSGCVVHDRSYGYRDGYRYSGPKYERKHSHYKANRHYRPRAYHRGDRGHRSHRRHDRHHRRH